MRSAKALVLELLSAAPDNTASVGGLVRAAAVFGVADNNLRVTLARLKQADLIETAGRGRYRLGPEARAVERQVRGWRDADRRLVRWKGSWVGVHTGGLSRTDRKAQRRRERALRLNGFGELRPDLYLRPNNLRGGVAALRERLRELGLEAIVFRMSQLGDDEAQALSLWDARRLDEGYRCMHAALCSAHDQLGSLPLADAARLSFVVGGDAIRLIALDPMLPAPIVDADARAAFIEAMRRFDDEGRRIWSELLSEEVADAA